MTGGRKEESGENPISQSFQGRIGPRVSRDKIRLKSDAFRGAEWKWRNKEQSTPNTEKLT